MSVSGVHWAQGLRPAMRRQLKALSTQSSSSQSPGLSWTEFFRLRVSKRRFERLGGVLGGTLGLVSGTYYFFFVAEFDPTQPLMGLPDPTIAYAGGALAAGGLSTALGISALGALWRWGRTS